jgi:hypothetical protein
MTGKLRLSGAEHPVDARIVVSFDGAAWSVSVEPASIGPHPSYWTNHELAMAQARLVRLEHGFEIVDQGRG